MVSKNIKKRKFARKNIEESVNHLSGTAERLASLAVFRSNNHMYAQIIDDTVGNTLVCSFHSSERCEGRA